MKLFKISATVFLASITVQTSWAQIGVLSPWGFQDRAAVKRGEIDQSAGIHFGHKGVSPSGADVNSTFAAFPYQINFGLQDKLEIGGSWSLQYLDRDSRSSQFGVSDLTVGARYRFFDANRAERLPGLDTEFGFSFPTASYDKGLGTGGLGILFGWGLVLPLDPVRAHFGMGYRLNTENSDDARVGHVFSYNAGASYPLNKDVTLIGEVKGFNHAKTQISGTKVGSTSDELYLAPGAVWKFREGMELSGRILIGLTEASSNVGTALELRF